jgi:WD40 repeat protein
LVFTTLPPGRKIGRFQIVDVLGQGGMGVVYAAVELGAGRPVALKVLRPEIASDPAHRSRFEREGAVAATIAHPNVVNVLFHGREDGLDVIALELVQGGSLKARLRSGPLHWQEAARFGVEIARALAAIHAVGLVHRDLKPENVLLDQQGHAKLADFGLVTAGRTASGRLTVTGELLGTAEYMAPEQSESAKTVDARADLYSLGAVLYTLVVGRPPFEGTGYELIKKHLLNKPRPPGELVSGLPARFEALVLRLLEKEPDRRPESAAEVEAELEETIAAGEEKPGRRTGVIALALLLALGAAIGAFFALRPRAEPRTSLPPPAHVEAPGIDHAPRLDRSVKLIATRGSYDWRMDGPITGVALTPDGKSAVAGDDKGTVRLFDLATGHERRIFETSSGRVGALAVSPDGKRIVVGHWVDSVLRVIDVETGKKLLELEGHDKGSVGAVAWSPDGRRILSAGGVVLELPTLGAQQNRVTYKLWSADTGELIQKMDPGPGAGFPHGVAFISEDRAVSCAGSSTPLLFWNLKNGTRDAPGGAIPTFDTTNSLALTTDRKLAIVGDRAAHAAIVDVAGGALVRELDVQTSSDLYAVSAGRASVATGGARGFTVWSATGERLWDAPAPCVAACALSEDGRFLLTGHEDGLLRYWNVEQHREVSQHEETWCGAIEHIDRGGAFAIAVSDFRRSYETHRLEHEGRITRFGIDRGWPDHGALSPDGTRLLVPIHYPGMAPDLVVFDPGTGTEVVRRTSRNTMLELQDYTIADVAFAPDGKSFVTADATGRVCPHALDGDLTLLDEFRVQASDYMSGLHLEHVALFQAGSVWVTAAQGKDGVFMNPARTEAKVTNTPRGIHSGRAVTALAGWNRYALSGDEGGFVKLWDADREHDLGHHEGAVTALALSPDETRAATAGRDGTVIVWETAGRRTKLATVRLAARDHARALVFESRTRLDVGTARGVVMRFDLEP